MARPIFTHELVDADFSWLLSTFKENHPEYVSVEVGGLPVTMFKVTTEEFKRAMIPSLIDLTNELIGNGSDEAKE